MRKSRAEQDWFQPQDSLDSKKVQFACIEAGLFGRLVLIATLFRQAWNLVGHNWQMAIQRVMRVA
jgi:hypothetical protein